VWPKELVHYTASSDNDRKKRKGDFHSTITSAQRYQATTFEGKSPLAIS